MTPREFKKFVKVMAKFGVVHMKTRHVEITLGQDRLIAKTGNTDSPVPAVISDEGPSPSLAATNADPDMIKHKVEQLNSLMKLSDQELVDQLFPEADDEPEEAD